MSSLTHRESAEKYLRNGETSVDGYVVGSAIMALADSVQALIDVLRDPERTAPSLTRDRSALHACPDCGAPTALDKCGACAVGRRAS